MTVTDVSTANDADGNGGIYFCDLCNKPINSESAFKRHAVYCRRTIGQPKKRKRSCKQCHRSKAKCSFQPQCSRCTAKGLTCEYERSLAPSASNKANNDAQDSSMPEPSETSPSDFLDSPSHAFASMPSLDKIQAIAESESSSPPRLAIELRTDQKHQVSALFLLDVIRALPHMLSRRDTFPFFLHGQWHISDLPLIFANCMHISQLYLARGTSPRGRELFYSAVAEERARLMYQLSTMNKQELLACLVMQKIYTLLTMFENEMPQDGIVPELEVRDSDIERITKVARQCFASDAYIPFDIDKIGDPNETWEEFIYAESRRRAALFWFVVSRVIDLKYGAKCPPVFAYRGLALPAPGALWGARTREAWEATRAELWQSSGERLHSTALRTLGDLIDSRAGATADPQCELRVGNWLASSDQLGLILMVASTMT